MKPKIPPLTLKDVRYNDMGRLTLILAQKVKELQEYVKWLEDRVHSLESNNYRGHR